MWIEDQPTVTDGLAPAIISWLVRSKVLIRLPPCSRGRRGRKQKETSKETRRWGGGAAV